MRVLLTGHNGYLGSVLGPLLQACGHVVVGLDSELFHRCTLGSDRPTMPCLRKDIREVDSDLLRRFDAVIHLAGVDPCLLGAVTPSTLDSINHRAAVRLAKLARKAHVRRFVSASSCGGNHSPAECDLLALTDESFATSVLRLPELYGYSPQFRADLPFNRMVCDAFASGTVRSTESGRRPLLHAEDAATAFAIALSVGEEAIAGQAIDVAFEREMASDADLCTAILEALPDCRLEELGGAEAARPPLLDLCTVRTNLAGCFPRWSPDAAVHQMIDAFCQYGLSPEDLALGKYDRCRHIQWLLGSGDIQPDLHWRRSLGEEMAEWAA